MRFQTSEVIEKSRTQKYYLCVLAEEVEGSDVQLEFLGFCKLSKADTDSGKIVTTNMFSLLHNFLAVIKCVSVTGISDRMQYLT